MIHLSLVGIGTGHPKHLTFQAAEALRAADIVLIPEKGEDKADLADLRRAIAAEVIGDTGRLRPFPLPVRDPAIPAYEARVADWHDRIAAVWDRAIGPGPARVALMVWGDPSLYDSTLRIAGRLAAVRPVTVDVIPGVTSIQALCAAHRIPLNEVGKPFVVTTGRRLRDEGWPAGVDTVVVMLDAGGAFAAVPPAGVEIWWSAYAGMTEEISISGPLSEVSDRILQTRAAARARHGWIMDIYLMRRA
ncbi:precorrin-6A synthase (deacetylating) [Frigidibacter sp. MR17.24]|uniref:precorrin-6A synthase (deacetylating) n=1 Tax=Frigidibacter sp. MR17.24 TaxID=3127345 RepID=UPI003012D416